MNLIHKLLTCLLLIGAKAVVGQGLDDIRNFDEINSCYLGPAGHKSSQFKIADSLLNPLDADSLFTLTKDSSYILKYYAFLHLLHKNDSLAFDVINTYISDSTFISTHFSYVMSFYRFNQLLINEYIIIYESRFKYGGWGGGNCFTYHYPKTSKKIWRIKKREFNNWAVSHNFENYIFN